MKNSTLKKLIPAFVGVVAMLKSGLSHAFAAGTVAGAEVATIVTDVVPVGTAVVTVSVFVYGYRVIKKML